MAFDLKTATPDASIPDAGFLFGADSQSATDPSIYAVTTLLDKFLGSGGFSGGTVTADTPLLNQAQTWNNAGVTFTGWKLNVTDTASASGSLLMDLQVGGASRFKVDKNGYIYGPNDEFRMNTFSTNSFSVFIASSRRFSIGNSEVRLGLLTIAFVGNIDANVTPDLYIQRDAANTLAQRNSTNAQTFNIYNTYTDASNYERGFMRWNSNALEIGAEAAGTGTARDIRVTRRTFFSNNIEVEGIAYNKRASVTSVWANFGGDNNYIGTESSHNFSIRTNNGNRITFDTTGSMRIVTGLTVATLPGTPAIGMMARVTDATAPSVGSTVTGGGAAAALVWYNGTNWTVIGV